MPQTIEIFLPDSNPKSIRIANITSRTLEVAYIPRTKLEEARLRPTLSTVGVYILVGQSDDHSKPEVYIGETENCIQRLLQHNALKDFWQYAYVITSKTGQFTKAHVKYLEWLCHDTARKVGRCLLVNDTTPTRSYVSEPIAADLHESFETISTLISTLSLQIFTPARGSATTAPDKTELVFTIKGRGGDARGVYNDEGFVVLIGSHFAKTLSPTAEERRSHVHKRDRLIDESILVDMGDHYELTEDAIFRTPSNAATSVIGHSTNGWTAWKLDDGRTLSDIYRSDRRNS